MKKYILIILILLIVLIGGFAVKRIIDIRLDLHDDEEQIDVFLDPEDQETTDEEELFQKEEELFQKEVESPEHLKESFSIINVDLFTEKDIYRQGEPFNLNLNIDYDGESFKAAIIYVFYRDGFSKQLYDGYIENLSAADINRSRFHAGYPGEKAFRIYDGGHSYPRDFFIDEGVYVISVYVYDCDEIAKEGYDCNPGHVFPSKFGMTDDTPENLIKHNIDYLGSAEKQIIVEKGDIECSSNSDCKHKECINCVLGHYRCLDIFEKPKCVECWANSCCKRGYRCLDYECIAD